MIALGLLLAAASGAEIAPATLAPPLDRPIHYRLTDSRSNDADVVRTDNDFTLTFELQAGELIAREVATAATVVAPPPRRAGMEALLRAFLGVPVRVTLDGDGQPATLLDPEPTLAAYRHALDLSDAALAARADLPAEQKAALRAVIARDRRLPVSHFIEAAAGLLAPIVPPLVPGQPRVFSANLPARGGGTMAARGELVLRATDADRLHYRLVVEGVAADGARLRETSEWAVARETGLLVHYRSRRELLARDAPPRTIYERSIEQLPATRY